MQPTLQAIKNRWIAEGVALRAPVSEIDVERFEACYRVSLPGEFLEFYRFADGMEPGDMDDALMRFWPLTEIGPVPETICHFQGIPNYEDIAKSLPSASSYFAFADYSILLAIFALQMSTGHVICVIGNSCKQVASSFSEFITRYAAEPLSILH
jgi:hypothetical protein